jgi:hypothetical protein
LALDAVLRAGGDGHPRHPATPLGVFAGAAALSLKLQAPEVFSFAGGDRQFQEPARLVWTLAKRVMLKQAHPRKPLVDLLF